MTTAGRWPRGTFAASAIIAACAISALICSPARAEDGTATAGADSSIAEEHEVYAAAIASSPTSEATPGASNGASEKPADTAPPSAPAPVSALPAKVTPPAVTPAAPPVVGPVERSQVMNGPPQTAEIPRAVQDDQPVGYVIPAAAPTPDDIKSYQQQGQIEADPNLGSLHDFMAEGDETSPIGIEVREGRRKLSNGQQAVGLLVVKVVKDSPAAKAGLRGYQRVGQNVMTLATVGASMFFPPAIFLLPVLDYAQVGESYDMIIGVDGNRVTNYLDFEDKMRNAQPGQLVYLSLDRNGKRIQVPVPIPASNNSATY